MSDGVLGPEQVAAQAKLAGDSFIVLTDHGNPNQKASTFNSEIEGVRFIGGSEVGLPEGHFTFFGAHSVPHFGLPSYPPAAMDDVREWGGLPILAYPSSPRTQWQYWDGDLHPGGIEAMNLFTELLETNIWQRVKLILFAPFSRYHFLTVMRQPGESFTRWDEFLQHGKTWGFLASDAHGGFHARELNRRSFNFPSYETAFGIAAIGIDSKDAPDPEAALRRGDFFNCVRGAGEPQQFEFYAAGGSSRFEMGSDAPAGSSLHVHLRTLKQKTRLVLKKDGAIFSTSDSGDIDLAAAPNGVYRVEAYLPKHLLLPADVPWIFSNPIFVGAANQRPGSASSEDPIRLESLNLADFHTESDRDSRVTLFTDPSGERFSCDLGDERMDDAGRWCAMRYEKQIDLAGTSGFFLDATANTYLRYSVELVVGNRLHSASCKVYPGQGTTCRIPYREFYDSRGRKLNEGDTSLNSLALRVYSRDIGAGFNSTLQIRHIGFYSDSSMASPMTASLRFNH